LPHDYKEGSDINPHIHWQQSSSSNVTWKMDYKWFNVGDLVPANYTTIALNQPFYAYTSDNLNQLSEPDSFISGTGKTISSILLVKLYRDDNVYVGDALAFDFDIHYQIDSFGSDLEYTK
jgi:hypothetical protein